MKDTISKFFIEQGIEYCSILKYSACREINPELCERFGISAKGVILYLVPYFTAEGENISSYAVGVDYHLVIKRINEELIDVLKQKYPTNAFLSFGDHSPIDERHAALISGLGILGENGLIINKKYGSYVFIGEIITDLEPSENDLADLREPEHCLGCGRCKASCPTGILRGEGGECLSAITQKKGELSDTETSLMIRCGTAWGCDICQRVCPYNRHPQKTPISDFYIDPISRLTRERLDGMKKAEFSRRAYAWRGRKTIERNLDLLENANKNLQN